MLTVMAQGSTTGLSQQGLTSWSFTAGPYLGGTRSQTLNVWVDIPSAFIGAATQLQLRFVFQTSESLDNESGGISSYRRVLSV